MTAIEVDARAIGVERTLVERAQGGDREAFGRLVEPRLTSLFRTALAILRHEADANDAVQQACVAAWRELPRLRDPERFDAWLGRTLVNSCRMSLRAQRRTHVREIPIDATAVEQPDQASSGPDRVAQAETVRRAFELLSGDHRAVLILHHVEERQITEIAGLLGIAEGTVKWRLHEARRALRRALQRVEA